VAEEMHLRLEAEPRSVREARRAVQRHLASADAKLLDALTLMTSELVTNAVRFARSPVELCLRRSGRSVRVEVWDDDPRLPQPREVDMDASSGRGLTIIGALANAWGTETGRGGGKRVWFEIDS
jgi:anti-sigma regulatory factor (Ser/Thr protein kinase)